VCADAVRAVVLSGTRVLILALLWLLLLRGFFETGGGAD